MGIVQFEFKVQGMEGKGVVKEMEMGAEGRMWREDGRLRWVEDRGQHSQKGRGRSRLCYHYMHSIPAVSCLLLISCSCTEVSSAL